MKINWKKVFYYGLGGIGAVGTALFKNYDNKEKKAKEAAERKKEATDLFNSMFDERLSKTTEE